MTEYNLPRCPRHPDDFGQSEEHVFCLREDCGWTDELCWEERIVPIFTDSPDSPSARVRCMRLHGHDEDHFGYKPDGSEWSWQKEFIDSARQRYNPNESIFKAVFGRQYQPSFVTQPADPTGDPRRDPNLHKMDPEYFRSRYRALYDSGPSPRTDPIHHAKLMDLELEQLELELRKQTALNSPPTMIKIDSLAGMTWDDETDKLGSNLSLKTVANGYMPSSWLDEPKTVSGLMTLVKPREDSKKLVFDTETTDRTKLDKWDLKLSPSGDIKFIDYDAAFFYEHYKRSTLAAFGISKSDLMCLHDEIQVDAPNLDLSAIEQRLLEIPVSLPPTPKLEARIQENRLKKFHCPDCGRHLIKKFGTPWCQKCDKAARDPDKR